MTSKVQRRRGHMRVTVGLVALSAACESSELQDVYRVQDTPANCSDFIDVCRDATPRVEVRVTDERGEPVKYAFLNSYYPSFNPTFLDEVKFPSTDPIGKARSYFVCTNDDGLASLCGVDRAYPPLRRNIDVWKSGYLPSTDVDPKVAMAEDEVRRKEIVLKEAPATTQTSKVMFMACQTGDETRLPQLLVNEGVRFTVPRLGKAVSELIPDASRPLDAFDTLILDMSCNRYEAFEELVVPENKKKMWNWIRAGGRLILSEINSDTWNQVEGQCSRACGPEFFDPPYAFDLIPNKNENCDSYQYGTIERPEHPLLTGVSVDDWTYQEYRGDGSETSALGWGAIRRKSVDTSVWNVLVSATPDQTELDAKVERGCFTGAPDLAKPDAAVMLMEGRQGKGLILVGGLAWIQGSAGQRTSQEFSPDAVLLKDHIVQLILRSDTPVP